MSLWESLRYGARRLARRRAEAELDEEIRAHLELETEENLRAGMPPAEAREAALRRFGNVALAKEDARAVWTLRPLEDLGQDLRVCLRMLRKRPGYAAAAIASLALGIAGVTAMFSVVDDVLIRPLPYPGAERIVTLREVGARGNAMPVAEPNFADARARSRSFEALAQVARDTVTVTGGSEPLRVGMALVSADFFAAFAVPPLLGRAFLAEESAPGGRPVAVVSHDLWRRALGGRGELGDATLRIDDRSYAVVGVMPASFAFPERTDVWIARELFPPHLSRTAHNWEVVGRLRADTSLALAREEVSAIGRALARQHGSATDAADLALTPLQESLVAKLRRPLLILLGAVGLLLLIACGNVANLMLAQATARRKELALRAALGATRGRLAQQFVAEGLVLALLGAAAALPLAALGVDLLVGLNRAVLPRVALGIDGRALAFAVGLAVVLAVLLGVATSLRGARGDLHATVKEGGHDGAGHAARARLRKALVVAQMALTFTLLIGAGLLARSFLELTAVDPGFRPEQAVAVDVSMPQAAPDDAAGQERGRAFQRRLLDRLAALPGVTALGSISALPMTGARGNGTFLLDGDQARPGEADYRVATGGYFAAMGIPLLRGRTFTAGDGPDAEHVAVISQALAARSFRGEDPIGRHLQFGNMDGDLRMLTIVGIAGDVRERGPDAAGAATVYACAFQRPQRADLSIIVRGAIDAGSVAAALRVEAPELPIELRTVRQIVSASLDGRRFSLVLFAAFAVVALLLAITGIYGVTAYAVAQRTHEIGIRMALGARPRVVLGMLLGQGASLALLGVAIGSALALGLTRLIAGLLYGVSATDPLTFLAVGGALMAVACLACYLPARRALRVDPMIALRAE